MRAPCLAKCSMGFVEGWRESISGGLTSKPGFILSLSSRSRISLSRISRSRSSRSLMAGSALYRLGMW